MERLPQNKTSAARHAAATFWSPTLQGEDASGLVKDLQFDIATESSRGVHHCFVRKDRDGHGKQCMPRIYNVLFNRLALAIGSITLLTSLTFNPSANTKLPFL